ncbi:MAG TPA: PspC domain-containing protein [Vicingaceae bacterium]
MSSTKFVRTNRIIAGVCAGIGEKLKISPWIVRIVVIILSLFTIVTILIYLILWLVIPYKETKTQLIYRSPLYSKHLPTWLVVLNYFSLFPVLFWPFVFLASIFFFDNPPSFMHAAVQFSIVICYPLYIIGLIVLSFKMYKNYMMISAIIPLITIFLSLLFLLGMIN